LKITPHLGPEFGLKQVRPELDLQLYGPYNFSICLYKFLLCETSDVEAGDERDASAINQSKDFHFIVLC